MPYNFNEISKRLKKLWFREVRQNWSHVVFSNWETTFPVPRHWWKEITPWVEKQILKILKMTREEFDKVK